MRIVVGASSFGDSCEDVVRLITDKGIELVKNPFKRKMTQDEIIEHLKGADGLLAGLEPLNEEVFSKCPNLKAIARIGIGMDNVDIAAAKAHGIKVSNTPEGPTNAVAEMTLTALLNLCHNVVSANMDVHNGIWKKRLGKSISELTVFIIGYGNIGRKTASLLESLGANILVYDKYNMEFSNCSFEDGIRSADAISIHASGKEEIISAEMISRMKDGVIILNSARGGLINEKAVYDGLKSGKISGFWGDALWTEPYNGILKECENAILTPHMCTYTKSCRASMEMQAVKNVLRDLDLEEK